MQNYLTKGDYLLCVCVFLHFDNSFFYPIAYYFDSRRVVESMVMYKNIAQFPIFITILNCKTTRTILK